MEKSEDENSKPEPPDLFDAFPELDSPIGFSKEDEEFFLGESSPDSEKPIKPTLTQEELERMESENRKIDNEQREKREKSFWQAFLIGLVLAAILIIYLTLQPKDHSMDRRWRN